MAADQDQDAPYVNLGASRMDSLIRQDFR